MMETQDRPGVVVEPFDINGGTGNDVIVASSISTGGVFTVPTDPANAVDRCGPRRRRLGPARVRPRRLRGRAPTC